MIVLHIESGLGNQMLGYCEYLALKQANPNADIYIENIIYDIPEANEVIAQWNGYELDRIFGVTEPKNIKTLFTEEQWSGILDDVKKSQFWKRNWNYPVHITNALNRAGLKLKNIRGDFEVSGYEAMTEDRVKHDLRYMVMHSVFGYYLKRALEKYRSHKATLIQGQNLFIQTTEDIFTGQRLSFKLNGFGRERIDKEIREVFKFPEFEDTNNRKMADYLSGVNGVAIHARRGDMLSVNGDCYKYGYFKRAMKVIRENVDYPVFVFFTNTGSITWCKQNYKIFGLDPRKDTIMFVDWNTGINSFRDMQLMSYCKHAIITNSSFGWWEAYFITNPNKITISPWLNMDTTYHC